MKKILICTLLSILFFSCSKKKQSYFSISEIRIPNYYEEYEYRKFWEAQGYNFSYSNYTPRKGNYKDVSSTNFLYIHNSYCNDILVFSKIDRVAYLKEMLDLTLYKTNDRFEIYKSYREETLPSKKRIFQYSTHFIAKNDSVGISIDYESFNKNGKKLKDYYKIVKAIENLCNKEDVHFKSTVPKTPISKVIAN